VSELDYSHLGGAPSYGEAITGGGDMLLQALKIRDAAEPRGYATRTAACLQRQSYKDNQELQIQRDHIANEHDKAQARRAPL